MSRQYLKDKAYDILRTRIINCEYAPGTALNETALMKEIGASRTPIHDAMTTLAGENLVTIIPKKGVIVNGITLSDVIEVFDVRIIIEPQAVLRYGELIDRDYLQGYLTRCRCAVTIEEKIALDEELHEKLYDACRNHYLRDILHNMEGHNHRNRIWRSDKSRVDDSLREHIEMTELLLQGDYQAAAKAMEDHLSNARLYALKKYT